MVVEGRYSVLVASGKSTQLRGTEVSKLTAQFLMHPVRLQALQRHAPERLDSSKSLPPALLLVLLQPPVV